MIFQIIRDFLVCIPASAFFAILFKCPRKAVIASSVLGSFGYITNEIVSPLLNSSIAGYFIATLLMSIASEILARIMKIPATIFIIPAIIALVPGLGLYQTMLYLVQGENTKAAQTGISTILAIISMAMALVLTAVIIKSFSGIVKSSKNRTR